MKCDTCWQEALPGTRMCDDCRTVRARISDLLGERSCFGESPRADGPSVRRRANKLRKRPERSRS